MIVKGSWMDSIASKNHVEQFQILTLWKSIKIDGITNPGRQSKMMRHNHWLKLQYFYSLDRSSWVHISNYQQLGMN
jgi:hypothetical protein